ncbi:Ras-related protein [Phytophthora cinnamomi]|uniref:Ras-related protein n=1 Tax=Phytophthora cinnamomi TaxID=4785 RepID=UPI00355945D5|nr:Ras-related protein [Phytophthora cinnamomi]
MENLFKQLNLHNQKGYLFGVGEMKEWAKAANRLQPGDYEVIMLTTMLKHYDQVDLARYIQSAKGSLSIGGLATDLQSALFAKWRLAGKSNVDIKTMLKQKRPAVYQDWETKRDNGLVKSYAKYLRENPLT